MARLILIVDKEERSRRELALLLRSTYDLLEAADGEAALAILARTYKTLSAVLLNLDMPDTDGYEILRRVQSNPLWRQLPILVSTAPQDEAARERAAQAGAAAFFSKPYSRTSLISALGSAIALGETASNLAALLPDRSPDYADLPTDQNAASIQQMLPIALKAVMQAQTEQAFVKDRELRYVCCSRMVVALAGLSSEGEMIGKTDYDLYPPAVADEYRAVDLQVLQTGRSFLDYLYRHQAENGSQQYSVVSKFPLQDAQGNVIGVYGVGRDITRERNLQSQLELVLGNIPCGIASFQAQAGVPESLRMTYFSDGLCRLFGHTREEYSSFLREDAPAPAVVTQQPQVLEQLLALFRDGVAIDFVYRARIPGEIKWINLKAAPGEPVGDRLTANAVFLDVTEQRQAEEHLRFSEEVNRLALGHSDSIVCRFNLADRTMLLAPEEAEQYGLPEELTDFPQGPVRLGLVAEQSVQTFIDFFQEILDGGTAGQCTYQFRFGSGWRWLEARYSAVSGQDGGSPFAVVSFRDITQQLEKETVYRKWQQSLAEKQPDTYTLYRCNLSKDASFDTKDGSLINFDFTHAGLDFDDRARNYARRCVVEADRDAYTGLVNTAVLLEEFRQGRRSAALEFRERMAEGETRWLRLTIELVEYPNSADVEAYLMYENINDAKRTALQTLELAQTDPLTGVLNRTTFAQRVNSLLAKADAKACHALLMLDIDGFKQVNDAFGHGAGDQVLAETAEALQSSLRREDLVGRLGGDEFVVFLQAVPDAAAVENKARRLCALTRKAFSPEVRISASVGIALAPRDGRDFETLYPKADMALYHVKFSGKDGFACYQTDMAQREDTGAAPTAAATTPPRRKNRNRMLIVEDNALDYELLAHMFRDEFTVERSCDGSAALQRLRHCGSAISIVLLDLMMPGMNGFALLEKLQQNPQLRSIPVIVVSGAGGREASLNAIRAGASDFVVKPVDPEVLQVRVRAAVSRADNERLRAKNGYLELQNSEVVTYQTVLSRLGLAVAEADWAAGTFRYSPMMARILLGKFDDRPLWSILLTDQAAGHRTVSALQQAARALAEDATSTETALTLRLKTPQSQLHQFAVTLYKRPAVQGQPVKLIFTFRDLGREL